MLKTCFTENSQVFAIRIIQNTAQFTAGYVLLLGRRTPIRQQAVTSKAPDGMGRERSWLCRSQRQF
jgi:hypothetical protein